MRPSYTEYRGVALGGWAEVGGVLEYHGRQRQASPGCPLANGGDPVILRVRAKKLLVMLVRLLAPLLVVLVVMAVNISWCSRCVSHGV